MKTKKKISDYEKGVQDMLNKIDEYLKSEPRAYWHWTTMLCQMKNEAEVLIKEVTK